MSQLLARSVWRRNSKGVFLIGMHKLEWDGFRLRDATSKGPLQISSELRHWATFQWKSHDLIFNRFVTIHSRHRQTTEDILWE